jgi:hypothetical protein
MNYILIDPNIQKVAYVDIEAPPPLPVIYKLIGCETIAAYRLYHRGRGADHGFYCDDEACFKRPLPPSFFLDGYDTPIYGRLLVFKSDSEGNEIPPTLTLDFAKVFWIP